ncbi:GlsB/YeaQ/YmgE family stress response membrane protein [Actinoplanes palleronii]|uniref:GlsB/YeaQ/YmgE family stress response membrane protein n=1 Tax=Actinoplanes palleronii TaxID=113570 RepID=A0ABQ4BQ35_9ACTN|nr:GlsB/YeaQ/YmgE family stress response membrane protein [Actinoplanes palleronii]GIE72788.1 hypothetical protein Apa02nite_088960 [Actinoplanes palleronii]
MTAVSLVTAVTIGLVTGLVGRLVTTHRRGAPLWLPPAVGIGAAVFATVVLRMADAGATGPTTVEVLLQVVFAAAGVALVAITTDRAHYDRTGGAR